MKPFAHVDRMGSRVIIVGGSRVMPSEWVDPNNPMVDEQERMIEKINAAHRARVREELEAFRKFIILREMDEGRQLFVLSRDIEAIDIDAFMDREGRCEQ